MNTPFNFGDASAKLVYVKAVQIEDLPREVRESADGLDQLYAVHNAEGEQLALVADRKLAFVLARQHDMMPVTVH